MMHLVLSTVALGAISGLIQQRTPVAPGSTVLTVTSEAPMLRGDTPATSEGYTVQPFFTVGERYFGYAPVGILDGTGVFDTGLGENAARIVVNHELNEGNGLPYSLANGTQLTGARVSYFDVRRTPSSVRLLGVGLAYDTIYDRFGVEVTDPAQINEDGVGIDGFARFCSAQPVYAGTYGFVDDIFFTGEETSKPFHPHGGTEWALDVASGDMWAVPALGRAAWESVTPLDTGSDDTIALLIGDDVQSAPMYLYIGEKDAAGDGSFLDRNGLVVGKLYAWQADNGDLTPDDFNGNGAFRSGSFVELVVKDVAMAGMAGYDAQGYLDGDTLRAQADALGCFSFSRPEDVSTNPLDGTQAVFASTGRGGLFPSDNWGTTYIVDIKFSDLSADVLIVYDADDLPDPDQGIRSPDNLDWADNGKIYIQEDRSTSPGSLFGASSGIEASVWELDPITRVARRILEIDRSAVAPAGSTDSGAGDLGNWESSGILDVTDFFGTAPRERLFIANVQAHGIRDGKIGDNPVLDEGGQFLFISKIGQD